MNDDNVSVWIYFTSGEKLNVIYTKKYFESLRRSLSSGFNNICTTDSVMGINFSHVTHYITE